MMITMHLSGGNCMFLESDHKDSGAKPSIINIRKEAICNHNFRTVLWTGEHLQLTVMSIPIGGEIGLEMHDDLDQFIKVESSLRFLRF